QALIARLQRIAEPAGGAAPCTTAKLSVSAGTGGENTTTWIGVTLQNDGAACTLQPTQHVSVEIDLAGQHAHVQGNPATLHPSGRLYHGGTDLLVALGRTGAAHVEGSRSLCASAIRRYERRSSRCRSVSINTTPSSAWGLPNCRTRAGWFC